MENKEEWLSCASIIDEAIGKEIREDEGLKWDKPKTLENKVFEALGEVSMCWSETPKGIFDSTDAQRIGDELMKEIKGDLPNAMEVLQKHLSEDTKEGSYYHSWQCNIAMAFKDEFWRNIKNHQDLDLMDEDTLHTIANQAAKNFLNLLIKQ